MHSALTQSTTLLIPLAISTQGPSITSAHLICDDQPFAVYYIHGLGPSRNELDNAPYAASDGVHTSENYESINHERLSAAASTAVPGNPNEGYPSVVSLSLITEYKIARVISVLPSSARRLLTVLP